MTKPKTALLCLLLALATAACGQKGPLFLPDGNEGQVPVDEPADEDDTGGA